MRDDDGHVVCPFVSDGHQLSRLAFGGHRLAIDFQFILGSEVIKIVGQQKVASGDDRGSQHAGIFLVMRYPA